MIKQQIEQDLKAALLSGDKIKATTLRGLKSAILYAEVASGKRAEGLNDEEIINVFTKEAKKRQESADLYIQGGSQERADAELKEKKLIQQYLPAQLSDEDITKIVDECLKELGPVTVKDMGKVIGLVKSKTGAAAEGGVVARIVKEKIS